MPRSDHIESEMKCLFEKEIKLHEIVTEDIRIGRATSLILSVDILNDSLLILFSIVEGKKRKSEKVRDDSSLIKISLSRAGSRIFLIKIIDHKSTRHLIPRFTKEVGRDSRVNSARESDKDFFRHVVELERGYSSLLHDKAVDDRTRYRDSTAFRGGYKVCHSLQDLEHYESHHR
jgi:hypothetical protein